MTSAKIAKTLVVNLQICPMMAKAHGISDTTLFVGCKMPSSANRFKTLAEETMKTSEPHQAASIIEPYFTSKNHYAQFLKTENAEKLHGNTMIVYYYCPLTVPQLAWFRSANNLLLKQHEKKKTDWEIDDGSEIVMELVKSKNVDSHILQARDRCIRRLAAIAAKKD